MTSILITHHGSEILDNTPNVQYTSGVCVCVFVCVCVCDGY